MNRESLWKRYMDFKENKLPKQLSNENSIWSSSIHDDVPAQENVAKPLRPRRRSYVLDYLSNFWTYPNHGEQLKRSNDKLFKYS